MRRSASDPLSQRTGASAAALPLVPTAERPSRHSAVNAKIFAAASSLLVLLSCSRAGRSAPSPVGLWVWHEAWRSAPAEIVEDSGPEWNASGALIRFCPDGEFRLATGELYRSRRQITLGSSDGLTIYEGRWISGERGVEIRYKLTDAEIWFTGYDAARARQLVDHPTIAGHELQFSFHRPVDDRRFHWTFESASSLGDRSVPRFVECSGVEPPHD